MARPRTPPAMRRRSGGSFLLGMFVGVLIGLGISLVIAFYLNKGPMPFITAKPKQAEKDATAKSGPVAGLPQGTPAATPWLLQLPLRRSPRSASRASTTAS